LLSASSIATIEKILEPTIDTYQIGTRSWTEQQLEIVSGLPIEDFSFNDSEIEIWDTKNSNPKVLVISNNPHVVQTLLDVRNFVAAKNSDDCTISQIFITATTTSLWTVDESSVFDFSSDVVNLLTDVTTSELTNLATTKRYIRFTQNVTVAFSFSSEIVGNQNGCLSSEHFIPK
jgi:hypothetical protein